MKYKQDITLKLPQQKPLRKMPQRHQAALKDISISQMKIVTVNTGKQR